MCCHPCDTQSNEALNELIASFAPKRNYGQMMSLQSRVAMCISIHNLGPQRSLLPYV